MALGYALLLQGQIKQLVEHLHADVAGLPSLPRPDHGPNPYLNPLAGRRDHDERDLTDAELREQARYWNWRYEQETRPYDRWWCSKALSRAQRELDSRGLHPQSWRDGTEQL